MLKLKSTKTQLILYLICFAIFLSFKDRETVFLITIIIAVFSALAIESAILYFKTKTFQITESSIITGLIVGYVISSDEAWFKFALASILAILSKHLISFQKRHLFNPAAFGIFLSIILLSASTQWKGTYLWYIVLPFGFYFAYKSMKIEVIIGYVITFLVLFGMQAILQKITLLDILGYNSYFYIFVMVIEPKTTPIKTAGKYLFGAGVAMLIFVLTQIGIGFDVELLSLLLMNAAVPLLNILTLKKEV
jgi:Na+-translocating ferredoxin:NAD+ oxidoreductase RnfD subunit